MSEAEDRFGASLAADDLTAVLPKLVRHYGEPYADSSAMPTYYLAKMARRHITVALTGDGGDELLGGYERHVAARLAHPFDRLPDGLRRRLAHTGAGLVPRGSDPKSRRHKLYRFLRSLQLPAGERFADWSGTLTAAERQQLAPGVPSAPAPQVDGVHQPRDPLDRVLAADLNYYLPDDLLAKIDIATMACSLESRAPLLDHRVVEWTARLPASFKQRGLRRKRLLADGLARHLPSELFRRPKMGFAAPVGNWLRGDLRELLTDTLLDRQSIDRGWIDRSALERTVQEHLTSQADHTRALWTLLMLELWHREIVEAHPSSPAKA